MALHYLYQLMFSLGAANETMPTHIAPCDFKVFAQASAEEPVVKTSSISNTFFGVSFFHHKRIFHIVLPLCYGKRCL